MAYTNMTSPKGALWAEGKKISLPVNNIKIYEGSVVFAVSGKAVYTAASGAPYLGVANETVDNTDNGNKTISVLTKGVYEFTGASLTNGDMGKTAYLNTSVSPNTITTTKPSSSGALIVPLGKIVKIISSTECFVRIDGFACVCDVTVA
ncbi:MAG: hypothetical protein IJS60_06990 [Abditibacteriota bacterium]|nr:hypothetical protein [Abditibacteriota bacterium]